MTATLETDATFLPIAGDMTSSEVNNPKRRVHSKLTRDVGGVLSAQVVTEAGAPAPDTETLRGSGWYIGGPITTFLLPMCQADAATTKAVVFADKPATLSPPRKVTVGDRTIELRELVYTDPTRQKERHITAVCEAGRLAGEVFESSRRVRVRHGDTELAAALAKI